MFMNEKEAGEKSVDFVKWFSELSNKDIAVAGGKGASLSEMYNNKFPIPPGFMITAQAYGYFVQKSGIGPRINEILKATDVDDTKKLNEASKNIRALIENTEMPPEMAESILEAYDVMDVAKPSTSNIKKGALDILKSAHEKPFVAVRSSATTEDLVDASFAGQQDTFLNVKGDKDLLINVKKCFSSLFTARAIYYRTKKGFEHDKALLSVVVQRMVDSDKSGVMFSKNPTAEVDSIVIEAVWGLGEGIVSGMIKPDHYVVAANLDEFKILETKVSEKKVAIVRDSSGKNQVVKLTGERAKQQVLSTFEIKMLAQYAKSLEEHYKKPQDIEFAIEGKDIFIVQSRPITTFYSAEKRKGDKKLNGKILLSGLGASPGISTGIVKIIHDLDELDKVKKGDVLVTEMTNPDMVVSMQRAAAIVTDEGGITSHAAIVSREMGIPCVVGTGTATKSLVEGTYITVDGSDGKVYEGKGEVHLQEVKPVVPTRTKIKVIVDLPDYAERAALSKAHGVGLVRMEGIIAECGKHPYYFVEKKNMNEYIKIISTGLNTILEHFDEMWVRTSDIRSDEYNNLQGSPHNKEDNPMLGDHGVRFSLKHKDIMSAEVEAIKIVAQNHPNKKVGIMVPQVISVDELKETKQIAKQTKMPANLKIGIMVETPAAVQIIKDLCEEGLNFVSFGTNDLTQYMLAIDRNNPSVQHLFNEMNPAMLSAIRYVIRTCKKYGVETSICGQAGSREDMASFLVREGIDSISVNADAAEKVSKLIASIEGKPAVEDVGELDKYNKSMLKAADKKRNEKELDAAPEDMEKSVITKDMEDVVMSQLEASDEDEENPNYVPGDSDKDKDTPKLNDAIPVDSQHFEEKKEEEKEIKID